VVMVCVKAIVQRMPAMLDGFNDEQDAQAVNAPKRYDHDTARHMSPMGRKTQNPICLAPPRAILP